ncbi:unnamed protein product [Periconia digitata]|uniref:DUF1996 domain-containing protein n=1 Tax=Periconia digitata TaxID=1303443 RepID=A0A9W4UVD7_9PLEO|nr:unnamed protein product [Periconia digitata]
MLTSRIFFLLAIKNVASQSGVDLDAPMLIGGGIRGPGAMLRFGCSQIVIERLDPLVNPGMSPSTHMHQIVGSDAFNSSMPYADIANLSSCTSCHFTQDLSNYWTANLYFKARNNTYKRIPQTANQFNDGDEGGITVYYTSPAPNATTAFKPGFRMLTGDAMRRTPTNLGKNKQQCYRCYPEPNWGGSPYPPCMDPKWDTEHLPQQPCPGGIRSNIIFPQCWDGKNLDSPNHQDHVAHPVGGPVAFPIVNGTCPTSHPVRVPQVMFEVMWDTSGFNDKEEWPEDGTQPLVLSTGDGTGYGQHGDYVFGWEGDSLQRSMDNHCYLRNCTQLTEQAPRIKNLCKVPDTVNEDVDGWMSELPGGGESG